MKCPHCKSDLVPHSVIGTAKEGALHCYECGCCFLADGKTPREGVPVCALAKPAGSSFEPSSEAPKEEPEPEPMPSRRGRSA